MNVKKRKISEREFSAFCKLIGDEEGRTLTRLAMEFKTLVRKEPMWKEWIVSNQQISAQHRVHDLLQEVHWDEIGRGFKKLVEVQGKNFDLEEGLFLLASFSSPLVKKEDITSPLDRMAEELSPYLNDTPDVDQMIKIFKHYVFKVQGYHGNISNYYDPENSYLHKVLDRKIGVPISLSCVCLLLAERLEWQARPLPLFGIGLPSHFIVEFRFGDRHFLFDPFNRGKTLTRRDCVELLRSQEIRFHESYLLPVDSQAILSRTISNLVHVYSDLGEEQKHDQLLKYLQILNGENVLEEPE